MPTNFRYNCPHCLTRGSGFTTTYQYSRHGLSQIENIFSVCGVCNEGLILRIYFSPRISKPDFINSNVNFPSDDITIMKTWPNVELEIPSNIPENISNFYTQGLQSLKSQQWDAASAMFRKTLESATKKLKPEYNQDNLFNRIKKMQEDGSLTQAMSDWSHEIRLDGNAAIHDEEPETQEDAETSQLFTEAFLKYTYSLPQMVEQNRKKRLPNEA